MPSFPRGDGEPFAAREGSAYHARSLYGLEEWQATKAGLFARSGPGPPAHAAAGMVYAHFAAYVYEEPNEELAFPDTDETEPGDSGAALAVHVFNP